jgi:hypothetical protein
MDWRLQTWGRRLLGMLVGAISFFIALFTELIGISIVRYYAFIYFPNPDNYPLVAGYKTISSFFIWMYPAAVATTVIYTFWDKWPTQRSRLLIYISLLMIIAPINLINYSQADQLVDVRVQCLFNLFTVFTSYVIVLNLRAMSPTSHDGRAIQSLSILLITAVGIVLPLFYTTVFGLVIFGWIDHKIAQSIGDKTALGVAGAIGAIVALLNALEGLRGQRDKGSSSAT